MRLGSRPVLLLLVAAFLATGCSTHSHWQHQKDEAAGLQMTRRTVPPVGSYRDFPGVIHVHSMISHDSKGWMDEIAKGALQAGVKFVVMTDHHNPRVYREGFKGWFGDVLVLRGSEVIKGCSGHTGDTCNSLLVIGVDEYIDPKTRSMAQIVEAVKERGGLAFAAHPNGFEDWDVPGIDGMEIYDILDDAVDHPWRFPKYFFDIAYSYGSYPDEVFQSIFDAPEEYLKRWDALSQKRRWVGIAGNDAHQNIHLLGHQIDSYGLDFRFVRTHILAEALTESEVIDALKSGHAYVAFDMLSDSTGFSFWAGDGAVEGIQGDEIRIKPGLRLNIDSPVVGQVELVRNGAIIRKATTLHLDVPVEEAGVYRVQISLKIGGAWRPWIYSNPIYIRESD
jgi:hypothetical protein